MCVCVRAQLYMVTDDRSEHWLTLLFTSHSTSQSDEALIFRACVCVCAPEHGDRVSLISFVIKQFSGRGAQARLGYLCATCANEAGLINHLYLQLRPTQKTPLNVLLPSWAESCN